MSAPIHHSVRSEIIPIASIIASLMFSVYFYQHSPNIIATHWDIYGNVNGYSQKLFGIIFIPILMMVLYCVFLILPYFDPEKENYKKFENTYHYFISLIIGFLFSLFLIIGFFNTGFPIVVGKIVLILLSIFMIGMGILLKNVKRNWFLGFRTPWTLSSDAVWDKTHHVGGNIFILYGTIVFCVSVMDTTIGFYTFLLGLIGSIVAIMFYSHHLYTESHH